MKSKILGLLAVGLLGGPMVANATTVIDTLGGGNSFTCLGVPGGCGQTFGQSFTTPAADTRLVSFGFNMFPVSNGALDVVLRIYGWDGNDRVGAELFASSVTTLNFAVETFVDFAVGIDLTAGNQYIAYLDTSGLGNGLAASGMYYKGGATYAGGTFAWERTANDNNWNLYGIDSEFRAVFSAVPEPGTLALLGLGLAGLGLSRRRKTN